MSYSLNLKNAIFISCLTISTIFYLCYGHLNSKRLQLELVRQQKTKSFLTDQSERVKVLEAQVKYLKGRQLETSNLDDDEKPKTSKSETDQVKFYVYDFPQTNWYINCSKDHSTYMKKLTSPLEKHYFHSDDIIFTKKSSTINGEHAILIKHQFLFYRFFLIFLLVLVGSRGLFIGKRNFITPIKIKRKITTTSASPNTKA